MGHTYAQCQDIMRNIYIYTIPVSDRYPGAGIGIFRDSVPGRDHQFHRDYRPGFADRTECYTRDFIDFYCKLSLFFKKNQKILNSSVIEFMSSPIEIRGSRCPSTKKLGI